MINEETNLNLDEATVVTSAGLTLEDEGDNNLLQDLTKGNDASDPRWDDLYKKYSLGNYQKNQAKEYVAIRASHLVKKGDKNSKASGYIKYDDSGEVTRTGTRFRRNKAMIADLNKLTLVDNKNDASAFSTDDADEICRALKNDPNFRLIGNKFDYEKANIVQETSGKATDIILACYFNTLTKDENGYRFINLILTFLAGECNKRKNSPLCSNIILRYLGNAFKIWGNNSSGDFNATAVSKITNLIIGRELDQLAVQYGGTFLGTIIYNKFFLKLTEHDIEEVFKSYREIRNINKKKLTEFFGAEPDMTKLAQNVILQINDDAFTQFIQSDGVIDVNAINQWDPKYVKCDLQSNKFSHTLFNDPSDVYQKPLHELNYIKTIEAKLKNISGEAKEDKVNESYELRLYRGDNIDTAQKAAVTKLPTNVNTTEWNRPVVTFEDVPVESGDALVIVSEDKKAISFGNQSGTLKIEPDGYWQKFTNISSYIKTGEQFKSGSGKVKITIKINTSGKVNFIELVKTEDMGTTKAEEPKEEEKEETPTGEGEAAQGENTEGAEASVNTNQQATQGKPIINVDKINVEDLLNKLKDNQQFAKTVNNKGNQNDIINKIKDYLKEHPELIELAPEEDNQQTETHKE